MGMLSEILPGGFGGSGRGEDEAEDPPSWQRRLAEGSDPGETARGGHLPKHLPAGCNLLFCPKLKLFFGQTAVAYMERLPGGINSVISLECLDQGKRWLQLLLSAPQCIQQWNDEALAGLLDLLGIDQVTIKRNAYGEDIHL